MERLIHYIQSLPPQKAHRLSLMIPALIAIVLLCVFAIPYLVEAPVVDENGEAISEVVGPIGSIFESIGSAWKNMGDTVEKIQQ